MSDPTKAATCLASVLPTCGHIDPWLGLLLGTLIFGVLLTWLMFKTAFFYPYDNLWQMVRGRRRRLLQLFPTNVKVNAPARKGSEL